MKPKKSVADIAIELMKKRGCTQINISEYSLLNQIAEKATHTTLPNQDVSIRQNRVLDLLSHDKRFKRQRKNVGNRAIRTFKLIET